MYLLLLGFSYIPCQLYAVYWYCKCLHTHNLCCCRNQSSCSQNRNCAKYRMCRNLYVLRALSVHHEEQNRAFLAVSSQRSKHRVLNGAVPCLQPVRSQPISGKIRQSRLFVFGVLAANQGSGLEWIARHQHLNADGQQSQLHANRYRVRINERFTYRCYISSHKVQCVAVLDLEGSDSTRTFTHTKHERYGNLRETSERLQQCTQQHFG